MPDNPGIPVARRVVPGIPMARVVGRPVVPSVAEWAPKYPEAAVGLDDLQLRAAQTAQEAIDTQGSDPWTISPASSHTEMFRLVDAGSVRRITVYDATGNPIETLAGTRLAVHNARAGVGSTIDVRFKPSKNRPSYMYVFFFGQNHAEARSVFAEMKASPSPWTVGYKRLEKAGIPYRRVSGHYGEV